MGALIASFVIAVAVAVGASGMGYSAVLWFFAMFLGGPFTLGLVSALPDRRLERKRAEEIDALAGEAATVDRVIASAPVADATIGSFETVRS
jgi:hypothetical protein